MLARGSLARWAAAKTSARDLPQLARFLSSALCARRASDLPAARAISRAYASALNARRGYATTTAATKPTATVKKAVKAQAQSTARPKRATASKTTSKTAKTSAKKTTAKKAAKKPKAKKAAPKKAAPKKKKKKELTPEEKTKAQIRALRKIALKEPHGSQNLNAFQVYIGERVKQRQSTGRAPTAEITEASKSFKELTPAQREHYNHLANEQSAVRISAYKAWINTHTPAQIRDANNARAKLRSLLPKTTRGFPAHTSPLKDDRLLKRPVNAYSLFLAERWATGDMKGITIAASGKMIAEEWKAMGAGEKKKYQDAAAASLEKYNREVAATYQG